MEREALEGSQSSTASPSKSQPEELFLFPAESSSLTMLPGVARVVHSKASCTVHWLESGKNRPNAKELPTAQILGIHTAPPIRTGAKSGRGSTAAAAGGGGASVTVLSDTRRTESLNPEPSSDSSAKVEEKRPLPVSVPTSSLQAPREEGAGMGPSEGSKTCSGAEASTSLSLTKSNDKLCSGAESTSEQSKEEQNNSTSSPEANQTPPGKPPVAAAEEGMPQGSALAAKERTAEQIREEGWSARDAENVTLAELYLMLGKPGKLQLEYEWQPITVTDNTQQNGQTLTQTKPSRTHRVLRCLLRLVATEVNPKPLVGITCYFSQCRC